MLDKSNLLDTRQIATFIARGVLRFDGLMDDAFNQAFLEGYAAGRTESNPAGTPLSRCFPGGGPARELLGMPRVLGIIQSLVGPDPRFDHQAYHVREGSDERSQHLHQDATIDPRRQHFDIQLMYFPQAVTPEMGGTRYVPGTHLRIVSETSVARYQNMRGQVHVVCPAGTVIVVHHGIWHGAGCNRSGKRRVMYKVRLNPVVRQCRLWNTDDLDARALTPRVAHNPKDRDETDVQNILCSSEPWFEDDTRRIEWVNRIQLWRVMVGNPTADAHYWATRLENQP